MYINNIEVNIDLVLCEITERKNAPWNSGRINNYISQTETQKLFCALNSGSERPAFAYAGRLYRIHSPSVLFAPNINPAEYDIVGKIACDESCTALPITQYSDALVAWSKNYNFNHSKWYKVYPQERARFLVAETQDVVGIDVNAFLCLFGDGPGRFKYEHEVLFPVLKKYIPKEYECTPNQFAHYMRKYPLNLAGYNYE